MFCLFLVWLRPSPLKSLVGYSLPEVAMTIPLEKSLYCLGQYFNVPLLPQPLVLPVGEYFILLLPNPYCRLSSVDIIDFVVISISLLSISYLLLSLLSVKTESSLCQSDEHVF